MSTMEQPPNITDTSKQQSVGSSMPMDNHNDVSNGSHNHNQNHTQKQEQQVRSSSISPSSSEENSSTPPSSPFCSLLNMNDLEIGVQFWERLDHAIRMTLACTFTGTIVYFTAAKDYMTLGFLAVVVIVALEPALETVGSCLQTIPEVYRGCLIGTILGVLGCVAVLRPLSTLDNDPQLAMSIVYPFLATAAAFVILIFQWVPGPCNGVATVVVILTLVSAIDDLNFAWKFLLTFCFGITTTVVFKLIPLPTSSLVSTRSSTSQSPISKLQMPSDHLTGDNDQNHNDDRSSSFCCCCDNRIVIRSAFALPKLRKLVGEGRALSAAIIAMLVDVAIAETMDNGMSKTKAIKNLGGNDQEDDDIIARRHALASIHGSITQLEKDILPKITGLLRSAQVEINLLGIASKQEATQIEEWATLMQSLVPTFKFLQDIVRTNHYEDEMRADIVNELKDDPLRLRQSFGQYMEVPIRAVARALCSEILTEKDQQKQKKATNDYLKSSQEKLLAAVSDHRFDIFYRPSGTAGDDIQADSAKWGYFARGLCFVQGLNRLVCAISNHDSIPSETTKTLETATDTTKNELNDSTKEKKSQTTLFSDAIGDWVKQFIGVLFGGMEWTRPFSMDRETLRYALNFAVQVGLATLWYAIPILNERMDEEGIFVAVTTCFISKGKFGLTFQKSVQRIIGTGIASIFSMFLVATLQLSSTDALVATYPYILVCLLLTDRNNPYTMDCAAFTAVILLFQLTPSNPETDLLVSMTFRIATVGIGIVQFIVVEMLFFRDSARTRVEEQTRKRILLLDEFFDGVATFIVNLDADDDDNAVKEEALELIELSVSKCTSSTAAALNDLAAAQQEPGPKIDVKPPFDYNNYSTLLQLQSQVNVILSQIMSCCQAMLETPEKDHGKLVYKHQVQMLVEMVESVRVPLKRLVTEYERKSSAYVWLRGLRRFKKSTIKGIGLRSFQLMRDHSLTLHATDKTTMVEQAFVLQWVAVSRCLLQLCDELSNASLCYERIVSSHPRYCAVDSSTLESVLLVDFDYQAGVEKENDDEKDLGASINVDVTDATANNKTTKDLSLNESEIIEV